MDKILSIYHTHITLVKASYGDVNQFEDVLELLVDQKKKKKKS